MNGKESHVNRFIYRETPSDLLSNGTNERYHNVRDGREEDGREGRKTLGSERKSVTQDLGFTPSLSYQSPRVENRRSGGWN